MLGPINRKKKHAPALKTMQKREIKPKQHEHNQLDVTS